MLAALRCELLKARRSQVPVWTAAGFTLAPLMGGLFMFILKDPARARAMGILGTKARLTTGTADWPTFLGVVAQATAVGGAILFAIVTAWVFGRESTDRTMKLLLAVPTPRSTIVTAKFAVVVAWSALLTGWIFVVALGVGYLVDIPGWSGAMVFEAGRNVALTAALAILLQSPSHSSRAREGVTWHRSASHFSRCSLRRSSSPPAGVPGSPGPSRRCSAASPDREAISWAGGATRSSC